MRTKAKVHGGTKQTWMKREYWKLIFQYLGRKKNLKKYTCDNCFCFPVFQDDSREISEDAMKAY